MRKEITPFLRTPAPDADVLAREVRALRQRLDALPPRATRLRARLLGRLGALLTLDPAQRQEARALLEASIAEARRLGFVRLEAANGIRYATLLQYEGHHGEAVEAFHGVLALIDGRRIRRYKDFALQHLGKCLAELGEVADARACLLAARRLRARRGDAELLRSTDTALDALARRTAGPPAGG